MANEERVLIYKTMHNVLSMLTADTPPSKHMLALLRHSVQKEIGEDPELFGWLMENIPEELQGKGGNISYAEAAIYTVLVMYPGGASHTSDKTSIAVAAKAAGIEREKLLMIEIADTLSAARQPLRALMQLLKSKGQGVDYRTLACDFYDWQFSKIKIARKWEREYARKENKNEQ